MLMRRFWGVVSGECGLTGKKWLNGGHGHGAWKSPSTGRKVRRVIIKRRLGGYFVHIFVHIPLTASNFIMFSLSRCEASYLQ